MKIPMILSSDRLSVLIATGLILSSSTVVKAQQSPAIDKSMVQAALMVKVFDQLSAQCKAGRGFNVQESAAVAAWEKEQRIDALRTEIGKLSAQVQGQLDQGATSVLTEISRQQPNANPCTLAMTITRISGSSAGASRSSSRGTESSANPGTGMTTAAPSPSGSSRLSDNSSDNSNVANLVAKIDSFGFDTRMTMGVGGFMTQDVYPVVLFRNGEALKDVKGLSYAGGLEAHRRDKPQSWTRWQRSGGKVQLETSKGWKALPFSATYQTLPSQFRLDGTYRSLSGGGTVAIGGGASVAAWRNYTFFSDGRVMRDGGAGSSVSGSGSSVVTSSVAPNQRGRYQVDGLVLRINYDDGSTENRIIITNPKDPKGAIWLDGKGYVKRKR
jgi:hypothetical protein